MTNYEIDAKTRRNRTLLWTALAVFALGNMGASFAGLTAVGIAFGVLTLLSGTALVMTRRRR
ncbi:hypothetical protein [Lentzea albida]|uniref:Uncharacterized protein n=1 Tax=Lentzea albida TaxID=65499 RepID=A0A1H9MTP3_9PSEU|nr:hypothetical protein [Lentzea albida]SER26503.1 hypothetical protein SAMN04488000_107189 [Lentzea albida]